jgi:uncharacterized phage protein gp47/JayE
LSGLTPEGFVAKRLPDIKAEIEADLIEAFGDPDLRPEGIFGQFTGIQSEAAALIWALMEEVYASQYPDTATGTSLDNVCALTGIVRRAATPTTVVAVAYGVPGTFLPLGREAANRITGAVYRSPAHGLLSLDAARSAVLTLDVVENGAYTVTVDGDAYTFTASGNTASQILTGIFDALATSGLTRVLAADRVTVSSDAPFEIAVTANIAVPEVGSELPMRAIVSGAVPLASGLLTEIVTAVSGWTRVDNPQAGTTGTNRETDSELRTRRERSIRITGRQTLPAIEARIASLPGVTDAFVTQNNTDATDAFGTLRQHVWAVVEGGSDQDIAQVLFATVAAGIGYRGAEEVTVISEISTRPYEVKFDRPTLIEPDIEIDYVRLSNFPPDGEDRIKAALVGRTFRIGEKLVTSSLYSQVNTVPGVQVDRLEVDAGVPRIEPDPNEKVMILSGNITLLDVT